MKSSQPLSREAIDSFKEIYRIEFGQDLSDDEALEAGLRLLNFLKFLLQAPNRPVPPESGFHDRVR